MPVTDNLLFLSRYKSKRLVVFLEKGMQRGIWMNICIWCINKKRCTNIKKEIKKKWKTEKYIAVIVSWYSWRISYLRTIKKILSSNVLRGHHSTNNHFKSNSLQLSVGRYHRGRYQTLIEKSTTLKDYKIKIKNPTK